MKASKKTTKAKATPAKAPIKKTAKRKASKKVVSPSTTIKNLKGQLKIVNDTLSAVTEQLQDSRERAHDLANQVQVKNLKLESLERAVDNLEIKVSAMSNTMDELTHQRNVAQNDLAFEKGYTKHLKGLLEEEKELNKSTTNGEFQLAISNGSDEGTHISGTISGESAKKLIGVLTEITGQEMPEGSPIQ